MSQPSGVIEKRIVLSPERANRLSRLALSHQVSGDEIVERALDILFSVADLFDEGRDRAEWAFLSEPSLQPIWDNDGDAVYDNLERLGL